MLTPWASLFQIKFPSPQHTLLLLSSLHLRTPPLQAASVACSVSSCSHSFSLYFSLWPAFRPWNPSCRTSTEEPLLPQGQGGCRPTQKAGFPPWKRVCLGSKFSYSSPSPTFPNRRELRCNSPKGRPWWTAVGPGACTCALRRLRLQVLLARPQAPRKSGPTGTGAHPKWGFPNVPSARGAFEGGSGSGLQQHPCHSSTA